MLEVYYSSPCHFDAKYIHPQFIPTPTQVLWEAFSHTTIIVQRLFVHTYPSLSVTRYSFKLLSELRCEQNCSSLEVTLRGFEPWCSQLRVLCPNHSVAAPQIFLSTTQRTCYIFLHPSMFSRHHGEHSRIDTFQLHASDPTKFTRSSCKQWFMVEYS